MPFPTTPNHAMRGCRSHKPPVRELNFERMSDWAGGGEEFAEPDTTTDR